MPAAQEGVEDGPLEGGEVVVPVGGGIGGKGVLLELGDAGVVVPSRVLGADEDPEP